MPKKIWSVIISWRILNLLLCSFPLSLSLLFPGRYEDGMRGHYGSRKLPIRAEALSLTSFQSYSATLLTPFYLNIILLHSYGLAVQVHTMSSLWISILIKSFRKIFSSVICLYSLRFYYFLVSGFSFMFVVTYFNLCNIQGLLLDTAMPVLLHMARYSLHE